MRVAIGVLGLTFVARELAGTAAALTVCIGALCTSLMDMPSPLRHKFNEMMAAALLCTLVTLVIVLCGALPGPFKLLLAALESFLAGMIVLYGKKLMPRQLAALDWQGWPLLERRVKLLQADADRIAVHGNAIRRSVAAIKA